MLSLTSDDMPNFTHASPEEIRGAQQKALHLWVGATSPLWAPFWLASAIGVGFWSLGQGFKRAQATIGALPDTLGVLTAEPSSTDIAGTLQIMVDDGVIAPMQAAGKAIQDMTTAVTPSPQAIADQMTAAGDDVAAKTTDVAHAATDTVGKATTRAVEHSKAQVDAAADIVEDTGSLLPQSAAATAVAADTAIAVADSDRPLTRKPKKN